MRIDEATRSLIAAALEEDIGAGDVTTEATVAAGATARARIVARETGVVAGLDVAREVFRRLDPAVTVEPAVDDGASVEPGVTVATVRGSARAILTGERVALNFLQRLSGVATLTARYVDALGGSGTAVLDTRKTTPGMRSLEKQAVVLGGGRNHRMGLWDAALIKDNHIVAAGGIRKAVEGVRAARAGVPVEVEVTNLEELAEALDAGVERVMLDNMSVEEMTAAIEVVGKDGRGVETEISGGLGLSDMAALAGIGADFVSVGRLTHSAPALDLSLEFEEDR